MSLAESWAILAQAYQTVAAMGLKVGQRHQKLSSTEGYRRSSRASEEPPQHSFSSLRTKLKTSEITTYSISTRARPTQDPP